MYAFELKLKDGTIFEIECDRDSMDRLIDLINPANVEYCEEL